MTQQSLFDEPEFQATLGQWHTPTRLAAKMVLEHVNLFRDAVVIEPAAGGGALVRAALDVGAAAVVAVELDPAWCRWLQERFAREIQAGRVDVVEANFLTLDVLSRWRADRMATLSNPPFDDGLDTQFLEAMRRLSLENVTLTNASALFGRERFDRVWSHANIRRECKLVQRPKFGGTKPDGSKTDGGSSDISVTWWGTGAGPVLPTAWWPEAWT